MQPCSHANTHATTRRRTDGICHRGQGRVCLHVMCPSDCDPVRISIGFPPREVTPAGVQVARSRMQQRLSGPQRLAYQSLPRTFVSILRHGGFTALYQGFAANAARVCPQAAVQFFLYEQARRLLG